MRTIYFYLCAVINLIWINTKKMKFTNIKKNKTKEEADAHVARNSYKMV